MQAAASANTFSLSVLIVSLRHVCVVFLTGEKERKEKKRKKGKRTDLGKCTHQYDEKQGNSNTRALSTKFF